jgi:hypothetical protein
MPNTVRLHRVLVTKPEKVYRAFIEPDAMAKWLPPNGFTCTVHHMDPTVGGSFECPRRAGCERLLPQLLLQRPNVPSPSYVASMYSWAATVMSADCLPSPAYSRVTVRICVFRHVGLELPGFEAAVVLAHATAKIAAKAGNRVLVADVCRAETSGAHASQMAAGLHEKDALAIPFGRVGRDDAGGGTAIDHYVHGQ